MIFDGKFTPSFFVLLSIMTPVLCCIKHILTLDKLNLVTSVACCPAAQPKFSWTYNLQTDGWMFSEREIHGSISYSKSSSPQIITLPPPCLAVSVILFFLKCCFSMKPDGMDLVQMFQFCLVILGFVGFFLFCLSVVLFQLFREV